METLNIKKLHPDAIIPKRATEGSAGIDLYACLKEPITINPHELCTIPTGIAISLPGPQYAAFVFARSGLAVKHGITLSNGVGVIDSDYRGEIRVGLYNLSDKPYTVMPDERIAQLVVMPVCCFPVAETTDIGETQRGSGGFGSTGRI